MAPPGSHAMIYFGGGRPAEELASELLEKGLDFTFYTYMGNLKRPEEGPDSAVEFASGLVEEISKGNLSATGKMGFKMPPMVVQTFEQGQYYVIVGDSYFNDNNSITYKDFNVSAHLAPAWAGGKPVHAEGWWRYSFETGNGYGKMMITTGQSPIPLNLFRSHIASEYIGDEEENFKPYFVVLELP